MYLIIGPRGSVVTTLEGPITLSEPRLFLKSTPQSVPASCIMKLIPTEGVVIQEKEESKMVFDSIVAHKSADFITRSIMSVLGGQNGRNK